jgi:hypothetical protein
VEPAQHNIIQKTTITATINVIELWLALCNIICRRSISNYCCLLWFLGLGVVILDKRWSEFQSAAKNETTDFSRTVVDISPIRNSRGSTDENEKNYLDSFVFCLHLGQRSRTTPSKTTKQRIFDRLLDCWQNEGFSPNW